MAVVLTNNATSLLAAAIEAADTTISVRTVDAGKFPNPTAGDWFPLTLVDNAGNMEVLKATARVGSIITVERAQENTTAKAFAAGARVDLRATAAALMGVGERATTKTVGAAMAGANGKETPADGDFFTGVQAGGSTMFKATWFNIKSALLSYLGPIFDGRYFSKSGGTLTGDISIQKNIPRVRLAASNFGYVYDFYANVSESVDDGVHLKRLGDDRLFAKMGGAEGFAFDGFGSIRARTGSLVYSGDALLHNDGNVYGSMWGGYLSAWLNANLAARVSDTRFAGYVDISMYVTSGTSDGIQANGYVLNSVWKNNGSYFSFSARQPQIFINGNWRALGAW